GFYEGGQDTRARNLFESYAYASPKVTFEMVDPDKHPELAEEFKVSVMGTTHIQYGGAKGEGTNVTELSEENITNGIIRVTKGGKKVVYFLDGEGEGDPDDTEHQSGMGSLRQALEGENFEVKKLQLASQPAVPSDCNILVIAGPQKPLTQHELDQIDAYLKGGGRAVVLFDAPRLGEPNAQAGLIKLMNSWGVKVGNDIVVDQVVRLFAGPALGLSPIVTSYGKHPVTKSFNQRTVFPLTRSVEPMGANPKPGLAVTQLAMTSDSSWAETDLEGIFKRQTASFHTGDRRGPITVADAIEADQQFTGKDTHPRLVVFGSSDFADNQYVNSYNRDLFMNSVDWLVGEENAVSIRPRSIRASRMRLTVNQFDVLFALSVLMLPELLLIIGIAVWWERRN
ncbi:MAG: Gldg family protein, partial [Candidatus Binataceae bacterium]